MGVWGRLAQQRNSMLLHKKQLNTLDYKALRNRKVKNVSDVFKGIKGKMEIFKEIRPQIVFSKEYNQKSSADRQESKRRKLFFLDAIYNKGGVLSPKRARRYARLLKVFNRPIPDSIKLLVGVSTPYKGVKLKKSNHVGNRKRVPVKYKIYIQSKHWTKRKNKYYKLFGRFCRKCGSVEHVALHHIEYKPELFGQEPNEDLSPLCADCHKKFHDIYGVKKNGRKDFEFFMIRKDL